MTRWTWKPPARAATFVAISVAAHVYHRVQLQCISPTYTTTPRDIYDHTAEEINSAHSTAQYTLFDALLHCQNQKDRAPLYLSFLSPSSSNDVELD